MKLNNVIGIILSLLILSTFGCHFQNQMNMDADTTTIIVSVDGVNPDDISYIGKVIIGDAEDRFGTDEFALNTATITEDTLNINASYGGGCEEHQLTLVVSELFLESFPVQIPVSLSHNANGDTCEAWLTDDYSFDLTPIKTMYQEAYQQEAGTIILRLKDTQNVELIYEFTM
jgi:hypothetical protein